MIFRKKVKMEGYTGGEREGCNDGVKDRFTIIQSMGIIQ